MRARSSIALVFVGLIVCATGCKKQIDTAPFVAAINKSFTGKHECVWPASVKLPAQIDPAKDADVRTYDAITDAGLLMRDTVEKPRPHAMPTVTNRYNLSDKGRPAWTADPDQPGYGNFCFGHFNVTAIDRTTPNDPANPTQYNVDYRYEVEGLPDWVRTPESMRTFRKIAADTSIQSATATLVKDPSGAWAVTPSKPAQ